MLVELSKVEQRYEAVLAVQRDGMKVTEVAEAFAVSRQVGQQAAQERTSGATRRRERSRPDNCIG